MRSAGKLGKILSTGNKSRPRDENDRYIPVVDEPTKALVAFGFKREREREVARSFIDSSTENFIGHFSEAIVCRVCSRSTNRGLSDSQHTAEPHPNSIITDTDG